MSVIEFAEKRLEEEVDVNEDANIRYWVAYLDGARAQKKEDEKKYADEGINSNQ